MTGWRRWWMWGGMLLVLGCQENWERKVQALIEAEEYARVERLLLGHLDEAPFRVAYYRGVVAFRKGEWRNALEAFEEAAQDSSLRPQLVRYLSALADTAARLRLERVAHRAYELLDRLDPDAVGLVGLRFLARTAWEWGQYDRVRLYLERYLAQGGELHRIAGMYFSVLMELGETDRILELGDSLRRFEDADALWAYGNALYEKAVEAYYAGEEDEARELLRKLVNLEGPTILMDDAYALLGDLALADGDTLRARRYYEQALVYALPRSTLARELREKLAALEGF